MRRVTVTSQLVQDGWRRIPIGVLPKFPTVGLTGCGMANAAGLKWIPVAASWLSAKPLFGSLISWQRVPAIPAVAPVVTGASPVSDGSALATPALFELQIGEIGAPVWNFVMPDNCQSLTTAFRNPSTFGWGIS